MGTGAMSVSFVTAQTPSAHCEHPGGPAEPNRALVAVAAGDDSPRATEQPHRHAVTPLAPRLVVFDDSIAGMAYLDGLLHGILLVLFMCVCIELWDQRSQRSSRLRTTRGLR